MKNSLVLSALICILATACSGPQYLPTSDRIHEYKYGSYVKLEGMSGRQWNGELIAVDSAGVVVLTEESKVCTVVPRHFITGYSVQYAQGKGYGWAIPVFSLFSLIHGAYAIFTFPLNLVTTITVAEGGAKAFVYKEIDLSFEDLKMFARFPQGIPPQIKLSDIH